MVCACTSLTRDLRVKPRPASLYPLVNGVHGDFSVATLEDCKNPLAQVVPTVDNLATNIFQILVKHNGVNREAEARGGGKTHAAAAAPPTTLTRTLTTLTTTSHATLSCDVTKALMNQIGRAHV